MSYKQLKFALDETRRRWNKTGDAIDDRDGRVSLYLRSIAYNLNCL